MRPSLRHAYVTAYVTCLRVIESEQKEGLTPKLFGNKSFTKSICVDIMTIILNTIFSHIIARIWLASFYQVTVNDLTMSEQYFS